MEINNENQKDINEESVGIFKEIRIKEVELRIGKIEFGKNETEWK